MVWFWDRLFLDFEIEFLSISSLWISVDMGLFWDQISFFWKMLFFQDKWKFVFENFEFSNHSKKAKILVEEYFWSTSKKDCDTKSATWFGLVTIFSPKTHRSRVSAPLGTILRLFCPHFLGLVTSSRFKRSFSVWFVFHSKALFSSRPITDSTNTLDFTSV